MFELYTMSIIATAGMCASAVLKMSIPVGRRLGPHLVAGIWSVQFLASGVYCTLLWLQRGLH